MFPATLFLYGVSINAHAKNLLVLMIILFFYQRLSFRDKLLNNFVLHTKLYTVKTLVHSSPN